MPHLPNYCLTLVWQVGQQLMILVLGLDHPVSAGRALRAPATGDLPD